MTNTLRLTVRFLQPYFHGRADGAEPEWPPSPLRLFQALTAAAAARWRDAQFRDYAAPALDWLAALPPPELRASEEADAGLYVTAVPNNAMDLVARAWSRGNDSNAGDANPAKHRALKPIRSVRLPEANAVHYLYALPDGGCPHLDVLRAAARSVTHLGWGVDMVAGDAAVVTGADADALEGERWRPAASGGQRLRVPRAGTLADLTRKHADFLGRVSGDRFQPVPPLIAFDTVAYARATDLPARPWAAFSILRPDASGNRALHAARRTRDVAAWVRHAAGSVCAGWPFPDPVASYVHGHDPADDAKPLRGPAADRRCAYLPLPTLARGHGIDRVEAVRRVLVAGPPGGEGQVRWLERRLPGQLLEHGGTEWGLLNLLPRATDWVLRQYVAEACAWSTVTPVIWPGHDDRDAKKAEGLLRKAFGQAGLTPELVAGIRELEWRRVGFRAGLELAHRYEMPASLAGPAYHVRVRFGHPVRGPLVIGSGRFRGFGLFAAESDA